jgi:hypothetical protein
MNKYMPEEYWSVIDQRTGKKIADCGKELDAQNLAQMHPHRTYIKNTNHLMGQVIDIEIPKALPTSNISGPVYDKSKQEYLESMYPDIPEDDSPLVLPEGQGKPVIV